MKHEPAYLPLFHSGELDRRITAADYHYSDCRLCPRECLLDRREGEVGFCGAPAKAVVASYGPHPGEEEPLLGRKGSGTIFFSHCNLRCVFCQNADIAHEGRGRRTSSFELAEMMLALQKRGCANVNLVTPAHFLPDILAALRTAIKSGFRLPLVYNTSAYESPAILKLLEGIVDIYLADVKHLDSARAKRYSGGGAKHYPDVAKAAVETMHRQVGILQCDERGTALRGLMLRHLIMPEGIEDAKAFIDWVASTLTRDTYVNLMAQYRPPFGLKGYPEIARGITPEEFREVVEYALAQGLVNLDGDTLRQAGRLKYSA